MSKIKPYIRCVCFVIGLVIMVGVFDYAFGQEGYIRYILEDVNKEENDYDTIVLGASHCRSAIDPQKLDNVMGTNGLNLGIPGALIKDSYYLLREAGRSNHVKKVILDVDYQYWVGKQMDRGFNSAFIYNQLSWSSAEKWRYMWDNMDKLDIRNALTKRNAYLLSISAIRTNLKTKRSEDYKKANIYSLEVGDANGPYVGKGFFSRITSGGLPGGHDYVKCWVGKQNAPFNKSVLNYFEKMKRYCDDNNIELICVTSPITPSAMKLLGMETMHDRFAELFAGYGVAYYDFNMARMDKLPREDKDYGDMEGHMGGELGEEYSEVLAQVLKKHAEGTLKASEFFYTDFNVMYQNMDADFVKATATTKEGGEQ